LGEALLVKWIAGNLRPFAIVEDSYFRDFIAHMCNINGDFIVTSRNTVRVQLTKLCSMICDKTKKDMQNNMKYFSATTDIWSSRVMQGFMALTIHYLTKEFDMINLTLEVSPLFGRHTGDFIRNALNEYFSEWGLGSSNLVMMTRDNGSNIVKACNDWGIPHFGCIGHSLHLVVGPLFVLTRDTQTNEVVNTNDDDMDVTIDYDDDEVINQVVDDTIDYDEDEVRDQVEKLEIHAKKVVKYISFKVNDIRKIATYFRKSTIAKEKLEHYQKLIMGRSEPLCIDLDVKTRWNSTYRMLVKFITLKTAVKSFLDFLKSPEGRSEFRNKSLPDIGEEDWALIHGICWLLHKFEIITEKLSGEKYPTFVYALPYLRLIKEFLNNEKMFDVRDMQVSSSGLKKLYDIYGHESFFISVLKKLHVVRSMIANDFKERFKELTIDVMWTTALDPRCRKLKHLNDHEKEIAKELLIQNVICEAMLGNTGDIQQVQSDINLTATPCMKNRSTISLFEPSEHDSIVDSPTKYDSVEPGINHELSEMHIQKSMEYEVERY
jgi:uncharacterized lipoprotein YehR (DUF1307 family)